MSWLSETFGTKKPVIGVVHLKALPSAPLYKGDPEAVFKTAVRSAEALISAGFHGIVFENFGDLPFLPDQVPPHVVGIVSILVKEFSSRIACGVNLLRNAAYQAIGAAFAGGGSFIRVNVHVGGRLTEQGLIFGKAHETVRYRALLDPSIKILADVSVKHSQPIAPDDPLQEAADCVERALADGLIVTGIRTGAPADLGVVAKLKKVFCRVPVFVGSGVTAETACEVLKVADGIIVGTSLEKEVGEIDPKKAKYFIKRIKEAF